MRPGGGVFGQENPKRKTLMRKILRALTLTAGAILFAAAMILLMAAPGLLSDQDSTVPSVIPARKASR
jgi:hypothetical protein